MVNWLQNISAEGVAYFKMADHTEIDSCILIPEHNTFVDSETFNYSRLSPDFKVVGLLYANNDLDFLVLKACKLSGLQSLHGILKFEWNEECYDNSTKLLTLKEGNSLQVDEITFENNEAKINQKISYFCQDLAAIFNSHGIGFSDKSEVRILKYSGDIAVLLIDASNKVHFDLSNGHVNSALCITLFTSKYLDVQLYEDWLFILGEEILYIYIATTGNLLMQINILKILMELEPTEDIPFPQAISIAKDGSHLGISCLKGQILIIKIEQFLSEDAMEESRYSISRYSDSDRQSVFTSYEDDHNPCEHSGSTTSSCSDITAISTYSMKNLNQGVGVESLSSDQSCRNVDEDNLSLVFGKKNWIPNYGNNLWHQRVGTAERQCDSFNAMTDENKCINKDGFKTEKPQGCYLIPVTADSEYVRCIQIGTISVAVWYSRIKIPLQPVNRFSLLSISDGKEIQSFKLELPSVCVFGASVDLPNLLIMPSKVYLLMEKVDQEQLINMFMMYASASAADTLSKINHWHSISMPLTVLDLGLKHHQLDTVAFFLKSRSEAHRILMNLNKRLPDIDTVRIEEEFSEFKLMIRLITTVIKENITTVNSRMFAEQLLKITMGFLNELLKCLVDFVGEIQIPSTDCCSHEMTGFTQQAKELLSYIFDLRQFLKHFTVEMQTPIWESDKGPLGFITDSESNILKDWNHWLIKSDKEIIQEGIQERKLPFAQALLRVKNKEVVNKENIWNRIYMDGINLAIECFSSENIEQAYQILINLGFDVKNKLRDICFSTTNRKLRAILIKELGIHNNLNDEEWEALTFLNYLEQLYPCHTFQRALEMLKEQSPWSKISGELKNFLFLPPLNSVLKPVLEFDKAVESCLQDNWENPSYSNVLPEWIVDTNQVTRERILMEGLLRTNDLRIQKLIGPESAWQYLLSHNDEIRLCLWISSYYSGTPSNYGEFPYDWPITMDMISNIGQLCTPYVRDIVLNEIARYGVFCSEELADFKLVLKRLSQIGSVLSIPHPTSLDTSNFPMQKFQMEFISYCLQHGMMEILHEFISFFNISLDSTVFSDIIFSDRSSVNLLSMFLKFRHLDVNPTANEILFQASLSNANYLYELEDSSIQQIFDKGYPIEALTTLLCASGNLAESLLPCEVAEKKPWKVNSDVMKKSLAKYSFLRSIIFPSSEGVKSQDVTVYNLLQGKVPFDITRLFGWQFTNSLKTDDSFPDLPYFSHPELVKRFGLKVELDFIYYLQQGRPSYAFIKFAYQELLNQRTISKKRINTACALAGGIAIEKFSIPNIAAGCIAFIEMLGRDTSWLRITLETANAVLSYYQQSSTSSLKNIKPIGESVQTKEIELLLQNINQGNKDAAETLLSMLEKSISAKLIKENISRSSNEAAHHWDTANAFCKTHNLNLSKVFLEDCAQDNNWIMFLMFAQLYLYPKEQIFALLSKFSNLILADHLKNAFRHLHYPIKSEKNKREKIQMKPRDVRHSLYTKIGLKKGTKSDQDVTSDEEKRNEIIIDTMNEEIISTSSDSGSSLIVNMDEIPEDLLGLIIRCHKMPNPWKSLLFHALSLKNPRLVILAAFYPDANLLECLCVWFITLVEEIKDAELNNILEKAQSTGTWILEDLSNIIEIFIKKQRYHHLELGFFLFQKESPLHTLTKAFKAFSGEKNTNTCILLFEEFSENLLKFSQEIFTASRVIGDLNWLKNMTLKFIYCTIKNSNSIFENYQLLHILDKLNFDHWFSSDRKLPEFNLIFKLHEYILETNICFCYDSLLQPPDTDQFKNECERILQELLKNGHYSEAKLFATLVDISQDSVITTQLHEEFLNQEKFSDWKLCHVRHAFWKRSIDLLNQNLVSAKAKADFFKSHSSYAELNTEKYFLLKLSLHWFREMGKSSKTILNEMLKIEIEMWKVRIQAEIEIMTNKNSHDKFREDILTPYLLDSAEFTSIPLIETIIKESSLETILETCELTSEDELKAFKSILGQELDQENIAEAFRLAALFNYSSDDLHIIKSCLELAEGKLHIQNIDNRLRVLLESQVTRGSRRLSYISFRQRSASVSSIGSAISSLPDTSLEFSSDLSSVSDDVIDVLEKLRDHCVFGVKFCNHIVTYYRIANVLDLNYQYVVQHPNIFALLKILLKTEAGDRFALAKDCLANNSISETETAKFLAEELVCSLRILTGLSFKGDDSGRPRSGSELMFSPTESTTTFSELVKLCRQPALLGNKLLEASDNIEFSSEDNSRALFSLEVELCIRAHDCFTIGCSTEGIAAALRKARRLANKLTVSEEFALLVRLLIGMGRFSEMKFIFDILKQHHLFELLLRKGMEKIPDLKIALLDYLKRFHPDDTETFTMVALHFRMYREIAEMLEKAANKQIDALSQKTLENSEEDKQNLEHIMQYLADAAESYIKANCLRHAQTCAKKAKLIALQIYMLPTDKRIINLNAASGSKFITTHSNFLEAHLVAEAYSFHQEWSAAIYNNVISHGNMTYLKDYQMHIGVTSSLVEDVAKRYQNEPKVTEEMKEHMKRLLKCTQDDITQAKLAADLGFNDITMQLLETDSGPLLQDMAGKLKL